jgi:hypothetical protein
MIDMPITEGGSRVVIFSVEPNSKHRCDDCRAIVLGRRLMPILDIEQRIEPGNMVPSGECPHCDALCYPMQRVEADAKPKKKKRKKRKAK